MLPDMPRTRKGERALGPYRLERRSGVRYQVLEVGEDGSRTPLYFESEAEAQTYVDHFNRHAKAPIDHDTDTAIDEYERWLIVKGNKPGSTYRTRWSLERFFPEPLPLWTLRPKKIADRYMELAETYAVDSHRNALAECKSFLSWCVEQKYIAKNPASDIKGIGKRRKRKPQLRMADLSQWYEMALWLAEQGAEEGIAALMAFELGMRASEIVTRQVRHLDHFRNPCDTLWIFEGEAKTEESEAPISITDPLRGLLERRVKDLDPDVYLFPSKKARSGHRYRDWVRDTVHQVCDVAGVPRVTAHAMRGALATMTMRGGMAPVDVAALLRHVDARTTMDSYAEAGAADEGQRRRGLQLLRGGKT